MLWWAATSVLAFRAAGRLWGRVHEAPEDLHGVVRATAARHGGHALLRVGFVSLFLDLLMDGNPDWAVPVMITSLGLFLSALGWNAVAGVRKRGDDRVRQWTSVVAFKEDEMTELDEMASKPYEDPGWRPAFKRLGLGGLRRSPQAGMDGVMITRLIFLALLLSALLILYVLVFIIDRVGTPDVTLGSMVLVLGIGGVAASAWTANRQLDINSASALAESYRTNFFLGFALNQAPLLMSFVFCFTEEELWPYLVDLPLYLIGMALIAPSRRNLARRQEQVQHQGSTLSLGRSLSTLTGPRRTSS
jgi:hypothetical protein